MSAHVTAEHIRSFTAVIAKAIKDAGFDPLAMTCEQGAEEVIAALEMNSFAIIPYPLTASPPSPSRAQVLEDLLRQHLCNVDGLRSVGECVDKGYCGCSCASALQHQQGSDKP